jgi:cytochrome c peroxidase
MRYKKFYALAGFALAALWVAATAVRTPEVPFTGHGDPVALNQLFDRWRAAYDGRGGAKVLLLGLTPSRALSRSAAEAAGRMALDLADGRVRIEASGLADGPYEAWLIDHRTAGSASDTREVKLGAAHAQSGQLSLAARLDDSLQPGFTLDAIALVKAGESPRSGALLSGTPSLFQRLYYSGRAWTAARIAPPGGEVAPPPALAFEFLLPKAAVAAGSADAPASKASLEALIAQGEKLFTRETFGGNGRTCATCHRPDNNHTIDPKFIAKLPSSDPLFIAETDPNLKDLERPALLRQFGLFVANVDGFDRPGVLRGAPHLLGLSSSLVFETKAMGGEFQEDTDYFDAHGGTVQAVGWSQDGAPDGGSLRDFTKGAVRQHMTRSLARAEGVDFRLPTEAELDAIEAYMLSLGRSSDVVLASLNFKSPLVQRGKLLFDQKANPVDANGQPVYGQSGNCNGCHMNAGALSSTTGANPTRDTGVERMRDQLHHLADATVPYDGGFGQVEQQDCGPDYNATCYSDGSLDPRGVRPAEHQRLNRFNTPALVEAADTAPFFHNNSVATLEEAVAYYNTDAFNQSPGAFTSKGVNRQTRIDSSQVQAVALFLRYLNVLENIRSANALAAKAIALDWPDARKMIRLAQADTEDAIEVIREAGFIPHPVALQKLEQAFQAERAALKSGAFGGDRNQRLQEAIDLQNAARADIAE